MVHRVLVALSLALAICFLLLSYLDPRFFLIHLYESLIYFAIVLVLFFREARWAFMLGIVAPVGWLLLALVTSGFGEPIREMAQFLQGQNPNYTPAIIGGIIAALSIAMAVFCAYHWKREFAGLEKGRRTFWVSAAIVVAYYGVMMLLVRRA